MIKKQAVQFRKSEKRRYLYLRLKYCPHCHNFSVLWHSSCDICGHEDAYLSLDEIVSSIASRNRHTHLLVMFSLVSLAVLLAQTLTQLVVSIVGAILLLAGFWSLQRRYADTEKMMILDRYLREEGKKIREALERHVREAVADAKAGNYKTAYEKLREVGYFLQEDPIKIRKVMYLNHFILRKDMDLELDSLIPNGYDRDFISYLREVAKLKPALLKRKALDYIVLYRHRIITHENGLELLTNAAGAALKMKGYLDRYQQFLLEMLEYLPKDRLLRLVKLLSLNAPSTWPDLYERTKQLITNRHALDPELQGYL